MGPAPVQPPRLLGRYALYEKIASGGMASVHIGRLLGPVGFARTVAIKKMHPQFAEDPEFAAMFLDEARLAARIRHPNVVPTLDVVTTEGELFLVMEYIQGDSLARLARMAASSGERIPPAYTATLMAGVLHGLHAAHEAKNDRGEPLGIVHRDVTPQNILVGTDGIARVLDFGVAKAVGRSQTTRQGQLKGKLSYMAPEQIKGSVSRATDVYAASVVLWETLAGKRLFVGENEGQILNRVLAGTTEVPSQYANDIPPALDALTMRGLNSDPGQRFATAREMARALEEAMPLVAASVIGEWVETIAKDALDQRSARIAAIETESTASPRTEPAAPHRAEAIPAPVPPPAGDDADPTQISAGSISAAGVGQAGAAAPKKWLAAIVGGGVGLAAVLGLAALWPRQSAPPASSSTAVVEPPLAATPVTREGPEPSSWPPSHPPAEQASAAAATSASAPAPPQSPLAASSPAPSPPPPQVETPPPPSTTPAAATKPARTPPARPPAPPAAAPAPATSSCHPPYYFDSRGIRVFKPECL